MVDAKPGRGSDQFPLRFPDGMRDALKAAAEGNGRSMNAEIISRLQYTFDVETITKAAILDEAIKALQRASNDMAHQAEVLRWMSEQHSVTMGLLEKIARTDGHLKPEFMDWLREALARRGGNDAGFPEPPSEE